MGRPSCLGAGSTKFAGGAIPSPKPDCLDLLGRGSEFQRANILAQTSCVPIRIQRHHLLHLRRQRELQLLQVSATGASPGLTFGIATLFEDHDDHLRRCSLPGSRTQGWTTRSPISPLHTSSQLCLESAKAAACGGSKAAAFPGPLGSFRNHHAGSGMPMEVGLTSPAWMPGSVFWHRDQRQPLGTANALPVERHSQNGSTFNASAWRFPASTISALPAYLLRNAWIVNEDLSVFRTSRSARTGSATSNFAWSFQRPQPSADQRLQPDHQRDQWRERYRERHIQQLHRPCGYH